MEGGFMLSSGAAKALFVAVTAAVAAMAGVQFHQHRHHRLPIVAGPAVTRVADLSEYGPGLKGTMADAKVFFLEGREPGGTVLLMAGTHPNEIDGLLSALIFIENASVEKGTVIVIPQLNHSASVYTRPGDGYPLFYDIKTPWGAKTFRFGDRGASPLDQWPDPDVYVHYPDGQMLSFLDARNTNRSWPGRPDGLLMEQVTAAVMSLIARERVNVALDLHGAETMFPVTNCIVAPGKSMKIATLASMTVTAMEGFENHVEPSPKGFRGLSHREIGDHSEALPFLMEAPFPFLDQPTGPKTVDLLMTGRDPFLLSLAAQQKLFVPYDESGWPVEKRVGQQCSVALEILRQYSMKNRGRAIQVRDVPRYADLVANGVGFYYHDPRKAKIVYYD
jgi:predicted deacylase